MAVDITEEGIILLQEDGALELLREGERVSFAFTFINQEAAQRYYNLLHASIEVGCIHIHMNVSDKPKH